MGSLLLVSASVFIIMAEQLIRISLGAKRCDTSALLPSVMDSMIIWPCSLSSASMSPKGGSNVAVMVEYPCKSSCCALWTICARRWGFLVCINTPPPTNGIGMHCTGICLVSIIKCDYSVFYWSQGSRMPCAIQFEKTDFFTFLPGILWT